MTPPDATPTERALREAWVCVWCGSPLTPISGVWTDTTNAGDYCPEGLAVGRDGTSPHLPTDIATLDAERAARAEPGRDWAEGVVADLLGVESALTAAQERLRKALTLASGAAALEAHGEPPRDEAALGHVRVCHFDRATCFIDHEPWPCSTVRAAHGEPQEGRQ